jgi:hypothetical protein
VSALATRLARLETADQRGHPCPVCRGNVPMRVEDAARPERGAADPIAARFAAYFATLHMTARLAHVALDLPWEYGTPTGVNPIGDLWAELIAEASEGDRAAAAEGAERAAARARWRR